ncbi:RDD family protein [Microbacterium keratanolyticum]
MIWEIDDAPKAVEGLDENGRPDPAYAAALGLRTAPFGRRVLATVLELALALLLALPGMLVLVPIALDAVSGALDLDALFARDDLVWLIVGVSVSQALITAYTIVQLVLHGRKGVTFGKGLVGIRSINVRTLERPGFWRGAVVRYLLIGATFLVPIVGPVLVIAFSPLMDSERRGRGWLDLAAATWFVDVRAGLNPYDVKRMRIARKQFRTALHEEVAPLPSLATPTELHAPAEYVPTARFSGGVLGAHRTTGSGPTGAAPAAAASGGPLTAAPAPAPVPASAVVPTPAPTASPGAPGAAPVPATGMVTGMPFTPRADAAPVPPVAEAASAPAAAAISPVRAVLVLDSGERIEVRATTLIGRAPSPAAGEGAVQLARIDDETRSVSKTHLAIQIARRGAMAVDRASTNGSALVRDGVETMLLPGHPVELRTGDIVNFGDRSLRVEQL